MEGFLLHALNLARRGGVAVQPNPQVGAVLVHRGRIVAEGWHQCYGGPHAEVHCLSSVSDPAVLSESTHYVSLEPCSHHGQTPPCADLLIQKGVPRVVIGCLDPNPLVAGRGVERLRAAGVEVTLCEDPTPFEALIAPFRVGVLERRPYITLKWAQSVAGVMGSRVERLHLSGPEALAYGHSLRATHQAILVGATTAVADNPSLTTRYYPGPTPIRLVLDRQGAVAQYHALQLLQNGPPTWVLSQAAAPSGLPSHVTWLQPPSLAVADLLPWLYAERRIGSVLVEGGADVLQQFLAAGLWDCLAVLERQTPQTAGTNPVYAPAVPRNATVTHSASLGADLVRVYRPG